MNELSKTSGQLSVVPAYNGCSDITGIFENMMLLNFGFHKSKNFFYNDSKFGNASSNIGSSLVLGRKY